VSDVEGASVGAPAAPPAPPEPPESPHQPSEPPAEAQSAPSPGSAAIHASEDAIGILDLDLNVMAWNAAAEQLYGVTAGDAVGRNIREILQVEQAGHPDVVGRDILPGLAESGFWNGRIVERVRIGPLAGTELIVDATVILLHDPDRTAPRMLVTNRDVTMSARLESELATLASLATATGRARSIAEVGEAALDILCRATGADSGIVASSDGAFDLIATHQASRHTVALLQSLGGPGPESTAALAPPEAYLSVDLETAPVRPEIRAALRADGLRHVIAVGLRVPGRLIGGMSLGWRIPPRAVPTKAVILQAAALVAAALENARLLGVVERGLSQERLLTRRMRALVELTRLPTVDPAEERPLDGLLAEINAVIGAAGTVVCQIEGDRLRPVAVAGLELDEVAAGIDRPITELPVIQRLIGGGHSLVLPVEDVRLTPEARTEAIARGLRSIACFAIRDDDRLVGVAYSAFRETAEELELDERTLDAIGRVLDISFANRRLRAGAEASERRYRELFEGSPEALVVQSLDRVVVDANPAARRLYGEELIGHSVDELVSADESVSTTVDDEGVAHYTGMGHRLDGTTFPEEVDVRRIEVGGEPRMLAIVRDLTERSRLQAELVQAQKMEAIGLLVAGVAHELNNPLASIVAFSQLLRSDPDLPTDLRTQADLLVQEANRTRVIVGNLLDFARQRPPERVETDLRQLVDGILGLQSYMLSRDRLTVVVDIPDDLPRLELDRSQFQQVLVNLTVNAAQAIHELERPGRIEIRARHEARADGPIVRLTIADDGPGVPAEVADRLFMPFVSSKPPGEGTGLGLSVSFGIVAAHGGTIHHESNAAGGATFVIQLPVSEGVASERGRPHESTLPIASAAAAGAALDDLVDVAAHALAQPPARSRGRSAVGGAAGERPVARPRILVLDDELAIRDFLGRALARAGYEPVLAASGDEALAIVRSDPPAAVLCDHRMAGMSGTAFQSAVAELDPALGRRFAFMSGDVLNPELRAFATERGVHLLAKPFDISTVAETVRALLATPAD
jgi:PAS domain S-box-containing protein